MSYSVRLRTKNHSAEELKGLLRTIRTKRPVVVRLGSRTPISQIYPRFHSTAVEINSIEGISNSRDKIIMKQCFDRGEVRTARWSVMNTDISSSWSTYPAIVKSKGSAKGNGIYLIESNQQLSDFIAAHRNLGDYIIEEYKNFTKEYRLHVTADGCFYSCRKMLKSDATDRWHRHDSNCVWIVEENPLFERPKNWDDVIAECVKALNSVGLTTGACDVKIQSEKGKRSDFMPDFIVMEINSAPSMGSITTQKYYEKITQILTDADLI